MIFYENVLEVQNDKELHKITLCTHVYTNAGKIVELEYLELLLQIDSSLNSGTQSSSSRLSSTKHASRVELKLKLKLDTVSTWLDWITSLVDILADGSHTVSNILLNLGTARAVPIETNE